MVVSLTHGWKWTLDQVEPDFKVSMRFSYENSTSVPEDVPEYVRPCTQSLEGAEEIKIRWNSVLSLS